MKAPERSLRTTMPHASGACTDRTGRGLRPAARCATKHSAPHPESTPCEALAPRAVGVAAADPRRLRAASLRPHTRELLSRGRESCRRRCAGSGLVVRDGSSGGSHHRWRPSRCRRPRPAAGARRPDVRPPTAPAGRRGPQRHRQTAVSRPTAARQRSPRHPSRARGCCPGARAFPRRRRRPASPRATVSDSSTSIRSHGKKETGQALRVTDALAFAPPNKGLRPSP